MALAIAMLAGLVVEAVRHLRARERPAD
jgi:hypothetical protein